MLVGIATLLLLVSIALQQLAYDYNGYAYNNPVIGTTFDSYNKYFIAIESGRFFVTPFLDPSNKKLSTYFEAIQCFAYEPKNRIVVLFRNEPDGNHMDTYQIAADFTSMVKIYFRWRTDFLTTCADFVENTELVLIGTSKGTIWSFL